MIKRTLPLLLLPALALPIAARADLISINGALSSALTFTPIGTALGISSAGFFGAAQYGAADVGVAIFGATGFTTDAVSGSTFPITSALAIQSFSYVANGGDPDNSGPDFPDQLTMSIRWNQLLTSGEPELDGAGTILTSSGDLAFETDFPAGGTTGVHAFFPTACNLADADGTLGCDIFSGMQIGYFEGGDVPPGVGTNPLHPRDVPEPSGLPLLLTACLVLFGIARAANGRLVAGGKATGYFAREFLRKSMRRVED